MDVINFLISSTISYITLNIFTNTNKGLNRKMPVLKIKFIQVCPYIRIHIKGHFIWLHHWISLSLIFIISFYANGVFWDSILTKGALIGGILHGLTMPEWKKIFVNKKDNRI